MAKKITSLRAQKKNPNRISIYLDGEFAFGLSRFVAGWLTVNQELDESKIAELIQADQSESAYQVALSFLKYRPRSEAEVRTNLINHQTDLETIEGHHSIATNRTGGRQKICTIVGFQPE